MATPNSVQREQLEDAFQIFNQVSGQLVDSYQQLQQQVSRLTQELSEARSERLRQLAEKESLANRLTHLLETLPAAVVVLDGKDQVAQINPAARELLPGIEIHSAWPQIQQRHFKPGQREGDQWLISGRLVSLTQRSLAPESGRILLLLDVTETHQLQERIARRKRLSIMGEMAAQLAHQIRTPLSSALLYTSHLSRDDLTAEQRQRFSTRCIGRLHHMESQVNDMLNFARGGQFELTPLWVEELLSEWIPSLELLCQEQGAELTCCFSSVDALRIDGNSAALSGALMNLAVNALQQECRVALKVEVRQQVRDLLIKISDNGMGISRENQRQIFDPFFTTRPDGTGLGLAVVQSVVLGHQGKLTVKSAPGEGACFTILLPLSSHLDEEQEPACAGYEECGQKNVVRSSA
ncbi:sensor histidine kinase [Sedimenticola sp.]|uniref:sensor histidine kinase n=1 Tax=Sedimenticola sp. TaxID=1940285 RepID=UPI003D14E72C